jgi:hypothetical protein
LNAKFAEHAEKPSRGSEGDLKTLKKSPEFQVDAKSPRALRELRV